MNEECGLIEWVPNLIGLRPILMNLYKEKGIAVPTKELKTMICGELNVMNEFLEKQLKFITFNNHNEKILYRFERSFGKKTRCIFTKTYTSSSTPPW